MEQRSAWYEALGRMVEAAAEFEGNAAYLLARIHRAPDDYVWTVLWEERARRNVSVNLQEIEDSHVIVERREDQDRLREWVKRGRAAMAERGRHVHSITVHGIAQQPFQPPPVGRVHPKDPKRPPHVVEADELASLERDLRRLASEALTLATLVDIAKANRQATGEQCPSHEGSPGA